jgi:hypothetical protein
MTRKYEMINPKKFITLTDAHFLNLDTIPAHIQRQWNNTRDNGAFLNEIDADTVEAFQTFWADQKRLLTPEQRRHCHSMKVKEAYEILSDSLAPYGRNNNDRTSSKRRLGIGSVVDVWWDDEHRSFRGVIQKTMKCRDVYYIKYEDETEEWLPLDQLRCRLHEKVFRFVKNSETVSMFLS